MALSNEILHLEFLAANKTRRAYQNKIRTGRWTQPPLEALLKQAYLKGYSEYSESKLNTGTLAGLLKLYEGEAQKHFQEAAALPRKLLRPSEVDTKRWAAARGGPVGTLAAQSDTFTRYWVYSYANRGILSAGLETGRFTRKVWLAQMDSHTSDYCYHLNGEIRGISEDYSYANFTGLAPPAHFRCRSLIRLLP